MGFKLKTSKRTKEIFEEIGKSSNLKPFALCKIAVSLSLKEPHSIKEYSSIDNNGLELQRYTVTGKFDSIYKALLEVNLNEHLSDDDYFPNCMKLHIDRGAEILAKKYEYSGATLEKFLTSISQKEGTNI